jgi:sugar/nucleoside kinase (ribokinase family)
MNNVLIVGSIGLDSLQTPYGERENVLGGSVCYASIASSIFNSVSILGIIGNDFPQEYINLLQSRGINIDGLEVSNKGTFKWKGYYEYDMCEAHTLDTQLNAFANFNPVLNEDNKNTEFLFLANIHPSLQMSILNQVNKPKFTMLDTMNLWITNNKEELKEVIKNVDLVLLNEGEARLLCETPNLIKAAKRVLKLGPKYVIIKKGEHGSMLFDQNGGIFATPAFPLDEVKDPTGAGDTFAGGLIGYLAQAGEVNEKTLRQAIVIGSTLASFTAQDFSLDKLQTVTLSELIHRYETFKQLTNFDSLELAQTV